MGTIASATSSSSDVPGTSSMLAVWVPALGAPLHFLACCADVKFIVSKNTRHPSPNWGKTLLLTPSTKNMDLELVGIGTRTIALGANPPTYVCPNQAGALYVEARLCPLSGIVPALVGKKTCAQGSCTSGEGGCCSPFPGKAPWWFEGACKTEVGNKVDTDLYSNLNCGYKP